jgi:hypothetical protein
MAKSVGLPFKDLPISSIPLFLTGLGVVFLSHNQFITLIDGNNTEFLFAMMMIGPACLLAVTFLTAFSPALCRNHLLAYVALISGVEIGIAVYLGLAATEWYRMPNMSHLEPTVVSLTLVIGCLQWSKNKWEKRVRALLERKRLESLEQNN